jgi:hypothetical protein
MGQHRDWALGAILKTHLITTNPGRATRTWFKKIMWAKMKELVSAGLCVLVADSWGKYEY